MFRTLKELSALDHYLLKVAIIFVHGNTPFQSRSLGDDAPFIEEKMFYILVNYVLSALCIRDGKVMFKDGANFCLGIQYGQSLYTLELYRARAILNELAEDAIIKLDPDETLGFREKGQWVDMMWHTLCDNGYRSIFIYFKNFMIFYYYHIYNIGTRSLIGLAKLNPPDRSVMSYIMSLRTHPIYGDTYDKWFMDFDKVEFR